MAGLINRSCLGLGPDSLLPPNPLTRQTPANQPGYQQGRREQEGNSPLVLQKES